jgi:serine/threonine protein kinase
VIPTDSTDAADAHDDFAAGWLLACKTFLAAGAAVPDLSRIDLPPELGGRLRRGAEALRRLHAAWPTPPSPDRAPRSGATSADESPLPAIGRFRVRRELGRGGFGVVYLAHDPQLDRDVAIKVPHAGSELDPEAGHRLAVEAQAAARLGHPNIVPVHESGTADGVPFVVSDYCPGISLADWLRGSDGPVPWADAARVVAALARGVHHAHARGVLHRDLKPANVLLAVTEDGPCGEPAAPALALPLSAFVPRVADFGMAKFFLDSRPPRATTGVIRGTPAYMAPEQAAGGPRDVTTAIDTYALGAVLYELLTRRPPFTADTPLATLDLVRTHAPTPLRAHRAGLPADLETVCQKCLEKDPARRYTSAAELADDLDRLLRGEPIHARRATTFERVVRSVRRYPAITGLSAVLALALVTGLVVTTALWQRTRSERDRAERHLVQLLDVYDDTAIAMMDSHDLRTEEMQPVRRQLLTGMADGLARTESQLSRDPRDPADRVQLARCQLRLASVLFHLHRFDEARAAADRSVGTYEGLLREYPGDPLATYGLTAALMSLANAEQDGTLKRRAADRARESYAAYAAIPLEVRGPARDLDIDFAAFLYDLAVMAIGRADPDAALGYLTESCDRLRPLCAADPRYRLRALELLTHALQFRCQIERFHHRFAAAVASGREALDTAKELCRERPDYYDAWGELSGAYNEYGLALEKTEHPWQAFEVWREGYERLGSDDVRESARGRASVLAHQGRSRQMIAYNLAHGYSEAKAYDDAAVWYRTGLETARILVFVLPGDQLLWYEYGMCCENLVLIGRKPGRTPAPLALHREGLASLQQALEMQPGNYHLRSELGVCWEFYAEALADAGEHAAAIAAQLRAIAYQTEAVSAAPGEQAYRDLLRSHRVKFALLVNRVWLDPIRLTGSVGRGEPGEIAESRDRVDGCPSVRAQSLGALRAGCSGRPAAPESDGLTVGRSSRFGLGYPARLTVS